MDAEATHTGPWGTIRYRTRLPLVRFERGAAGAAWRDTARAIQGEIRDELEAAYPTLVGVRTYSRATAGRASVGWTISDPTFFYQEFDTRPHWAPYGRNSRLAQWARDRVLDPFSVAWRMAPTDQGGGGGTYSARTGRMVATHGQYAATDLAHALAATLGARWSAALAADIRAQVGGAPR